MISTSLHITTAALPSRWSSQPISMELGLSPLSRRTSTPARSVRGSQKLLARRLRLGTTIGTDATIRHVLRMALALRPASPTRGDARVEQQPGDVRVVSRQARDHPPGRGTHIGAIQVESNAL